jgi:hypothetical protein
MKMSKLVHIYDTGLNGISELKQFCPVCASLIEAGEEKVELRNNAMGFVTPRNIEFANGVLDRYENIVNLAKPLGHTTYHKIALFNVLATVLGAETALEVMEGSGWLRENNA